MGPSRESDVVSRELLEGMERSVANASYTA